MSACAAPEYDRLRRHSPPHPAYDRLAHTLAATPCGTASAYDVMSRLSPALEEAAVEYDHLQKRPAAAMIDNVAYETCEPAAETMIDNPAYEKCEPVEYDHLCRTPPQTPRAEQRKLSQRPLPPLPRRASVPAVVSQLTPPTTPVLPRRASAPTVRPRSLKAAVTAGTPYFHGAITREDADARLAADCGAYLVREVVPEEQYVLSVRGPNKTFHFFIERSVHVNGQLGSHFILSGHRLPECCSVNEVVAHLQRFPSRFPEVPRLFDPCSAPL